MRGRHFTGRGAGVIAIALLLAAACGDDDGGETTPGVGPAVSDGGTSEDDATNPRADGSTTDPSPEAGGPTVLDLDCPKLAMPGGAPAVYVDANAGATGDGSKAAPYRTVAQALGRVAAGETIWVAKGLYRENVDVGKNVVLHGGFDPGFQARTDACATILEASNGARAVITSAATVKSFTLEGFTVRKGARGISVTGDSSVGAVYTISSSVFAENGRPDVTGGGASFDRVSAKISRTAFRDNRGERGGAISLYGDVATIAIEDSLFERNIGHSDHGGALYVSPKAGTITRSTFRKNEIGKDTGYGGWGGALIVYKAGSTAVKVDLSFNVFTDNLASVGAAVFADDGATITMSHDLIYRNRSILENGVARGVAIYADGNGTGSAGSTIVADHLTVANNIYDANGNPVTTRGGGVYLETLSKATFTNCIFWNNGNEAMWGDPSTSINASHTIMPSQCAGGTKCTIGAGVFMPPAIHFVDEATGDYHEKSTAGHFAKGTWVSDAVTSPAIDKADPAASVASEPAPNGGRANLGVYGRTVEASKSP